jgi:hypothetical protein
MNKIKILAISAALTVPAVLPSMAMAMKCSWT